MAESVSPSGHVMRLLGVLCIAAVMAGSSHAACAPETVLVISIDALHPDAIAMADTPTLDSVMSRGSYTLYGKSTTPPKTLVAHSAMMTGTAPEHGGRTDNAWQPDEPVEHRPTVFAHARANGYATAYVYSKEKLGYLAVADAEQTVFDRDLPADTAARIIREADTALFVFVHLGGLDQVGPRSGWLSDTYIEELELIDEDIAPLAAAARTRGPYATVILSDHAGHGREHGTDNPEDYRLPILVDAPGCDAGIIPEQQWYVGELPVLLNRLMEP